MGVCVLASAALAIGQPSTGRRLVRPPEVASDPAPARDGTSSLESHLAISVAERLLASDNPDDRVRGVERLVSSGQREAIDRVLRAFESGSIVGHDPRARLTAIRGLSPFLLRDAVRRVMERELAVEPGGAPLATLVRDTAAMALAASGDKSSLEVLVAVLRQGGSSAAVARQALLAHPPKTLEPFASRGGLSAAICDVLGELGDQRAIALLRGALRFVRKPSPDDDTLGSANEDEDGKARLAAARALARLGDQDQVPVARNWAASPEPFQKLTGVSVLLSSGAPDARAMLVPLLSGATSRQALELARSIPSPELAPALAQLAAAPDDWRVAVWTLGSIGGKQAVATLVTLMGDPARSWEAAFSLARAPGDEARTALETAQLNPRLRRLAARAGTVRALALGDAPSGLTKLLRELVASKDDSDRAAGAYGLAVLREKSVRDLVSSSDRIIVRAAARAALVLGGDAARACAERLAGERDAATRAALAIALVSDPAARAISTEQLAAWAEANEPFAPLAVLALGTREELGTERRIGRILASPDPVLRVHAALALAHSPLESAVSRLIAAWRFEGDASVRREIVAALAQRREPQRTAVLELVMQLDPDEQAREAARLGLLGRFPLPVDRLGAGCAGNDRTVGGCYVACFAHVASKAASPASVGGQAGRWLDASGLALPLVTDPDGALVVAGVSPGDSSFDLASSAFWYDAHPNDAAEGQPAAR